MNRFHRSTAQARSRKTVSGPLVAFLLIAGLGIMFAGCASKVAVKTETSAGDEFAFTEEDVARFHRLAQGLSETGATVPVQRTGSSALAVAPGSAPATPATLDLSMAHTYGAVRRGEKEMGDNLYKVTNDILRVRAEPSTNAALLITLRDGDALAVVEFINGEWAKVKLADGKTTGFVASRYIAKVVNDERLTEEEKAFAGLYYVNFTFVNVRAAADQQSEKLGEIPGRQFVHPLSRDGEWARVLFNGQEGYVSTKYLSPFRPNFLVRQGNFTLPILLYSLDQKGALGAVIAHAKKLKETGANTMAMRDFRDLVLAQEKRDVRLPPKSVVLAIAGATPENVKATSDALTGNKIRATLFVQTQHVGLSGITEKMLQTLSANGLDVQSGGHMGDDLRGLTTAQIKLELEQSRGMLERATGQPVFAVLFPQGGVNDRVVELAAGAGYLFGISNMPEAAFTRDQFLRLPAYEVKGSMTPDDAVKLVVK